MNRDPALVTTRDGDGPVLTGMPPLDPAKEGP